MRYHTRIFSITILVTATAVIAGIALFLIRGVSVQEPAQQARSAVSDVPILLIGEPSAPVTVVEYSDFKCPNCGAFHAEAGKQIRDAYVASGKVKIEFRPYPIFGGESPKLLAGAYCVAAQHPSAFTLYHDRLFAYMWDNYYKRGAYDAAVQPVIVGSVLSAILSDIGIDEAAYTACLNADSTKAAFNAALEASGPDGVQGTPTLLINGQKIVGPQPFEIYKTVLDLQL